MPWGLKRYYGTGSLHFITWSCYRRSPLLGSPARRDLVLTALELMRVRYRYAVIGYVVMPEHVHLLISEPLIGDPSKIIQAVKLSVSRRLAIAGEFSGRFWQSRFYDFNLWGHQKEIEKLKYMHRNPVVRGLVASPEDWRWSSYRSYAYGEAGLVRINDWTWGRRKFDGALAEGWLVSAKSPTSRKGREKWGTRLVRRMAVVATDSMLTERRD
ncbi:MAG TPA: transposase [Terriglobales bacterium]|nr:transposase [Terriglobales bacterium]